VGFQKYDCFLVPRMSYEWSMELESGRNLEEILFHFLVFDLIEDLFATAKFYTNLLSLHL
jgi:hypothetical protein